MSLVCLFQRGRFSFNSWVLKRFLVKKIQKGITPHFLKGFCDVSPMLPASACDAESRCSLTRVPMRGGGDGSRCPPPLHSNTNAAMFSVLGPLGSHGPARPGRQEPSSQQTGPSLWSTHLLEQKRRCRSRRTKGQPASANGHELARQTEPEEQRDLSAW